MYFHWDGQDLILQVRVVPNASRSEIAGPHLDRLRIKIAATARDGKANARLVDFLAEQFGVPKRRIIIESGSTSRNKRIRIRHPAALPDFCSPP